MKKSITYQPNSRTVGQLAESLEEIIAESGEDALIDGITHEADHYSYGRTAVVLHIAVSPGGVR